MLFDLIIAFLIGVLLIMFIRWGLPKCGMPEDMVNVISVILALILILFLLRHGGVFGDAPRGRLFSLGNSLPG